jgi:hypothetical protein
MTPVEFLRAVWPRTGHYCLFARIGKRAHWTYDTVEEAAEAAVAKAQQTDVYFAVHSLREKQVPHPTEKNPDGSPLMQVRTGPNALAARCLILDVDVDPNDDKKYPDQRSAIAALKQFVIDTQLPFPMLVSSGGGIHVYWLLSDDLTADERADLATKLRQLTDHHGLKTDRKCTCDRARVLRVPGTFNYKDPRNPRPVVFMAHGQVTATGVLTKLILDALTRAGQEAKDAPKLYQAEAASLLGSNTDAVYDGPRPRMLAVLQQCAQMMRLYRLKGNFSEPEWYHSVIGVGRFTEEGNRGVHKLSHGHPGYSEASCNAKIAQSEAKQKAPSSCRAIAEASDVGDSLCVGCPHQGHVPGPIHAGRKADAKPSPQFTELVANQVVTTKIPDPPKPFARTQAGIVIKVKNADGSEEYNTIYEYDLFPVRRLANHQSQTQQQLWHVELPNGESRDFVIDAAALYDPRQFSVAISNQGIYSTRNHVVTLQEYMIAYIKELQRLAPADEQRNHLGWSEDKSSFTLPDKMMMADGTVRAAQLSLGAQRSSSDVCKAGTLQRQVELLRFYDRPEYVASQFVICASLGAAIFHATGHNGMIINATGEAGASKSTTLYTAASLWGHPTLYPINGTNDGATKRARNERVTVLANLPICVDEITNLPPNDVRDLAMGITQPNPRLRLQQDGVERAHSKSLKSTIMLTTANSSLHNILSQESTQGTAGSMRVFEIVFRITNVHHKWEADDYLRELKLNHGHIGEQFMLYVLRNLDAVEKRIQQVQREIDERFKIAQSERFWSAGAASSVVAAEICLKLGLLSFNPEPIRTWAGGQIEVMRGVVREEYSDPLTVLTNYLEAIDNHIIVTKKFQSGQLSSTGVTRRPTGPLLAHYDVDDEMMYILKSGFKEHCGRVGANSSQILRDLEMPRDGLRIIPQRNTRRVLGAGTDYAKGQTWCFAVNMAHPGVSGEVVMRVIEGGGQAAAKSGATLKAVP